MSALLFFRPIFATRARAFLLALCLSILTLVCGVLLLGLSGWFLTAASLTSLGAAFNLFGPSSAVRGLSLLRILSRYGEKLVGHDATLGTLTDIRQWLFRALMPQVARVQRDMRHGDLVSRLTADVDALDIVFLLGVGPMVTGLVVGIAVSAMLAALLPGAALGYGLAMAAAMIATPLILATATRRIGGEAVTASARLRTLALDAIEGHGDLIALDAVRRSQTDFHAAGAALGRTRRHLAARSALAMAVIHLLAGAALLSTLLAGLPALADGTLGGPRFIGLVLVVVGSFEASAGTVRSVARLGASMAAAERLRDLATQPPAVRSPADPIPIGDARTIELRDVGFGFEADRFVVRHLDLDVHAGECVFIKGPSGGGKSTLLRLLMRIEDVVEGTVRIGSRDVRDVALNDLRRRIALLEQGAPVFLGTIEANLRIGDAQATDDQLWKAMDAARLGDVVRSLPDGLATFVGEGGRTLSAGQIRRLCLARTLLSPARILLLDEPTSGLDRDTELTFFRDLRAATSGRTLIVATHAEVPTGLADRTFAMRTGTLEVL